MAWLIIVTLWWVVLAPSFSLECILSGSISSGFRMRCHRDKGGKTDHGTEDMNQAKCQCQIAGNRLSVSIDVKAFESGGPLNWTCQDGLSNTGQDNNGSHPVSMNINVNPCLNQETYECKGDQDEAATRWPEKMTGTSNEDAYTIGTAAGSSCAILLVILSLFLAFVLRKRIEATRGTDTNQTEATPQTVQVPYDENASSDNSDRFSPSEVRVYLEFTATENSVPIPDYENTKSQSNSQAKSQEQSPEGSHLHEVSRSDYENVPRQKNRPAKPRGLKTVEDGLHNVQDTVYANLPSNKSRQQKHKGPKHAFNSHSVQDTVYANLPSNKSRQQKHKGPKHPFNSHRVSIPDYENMRSDGGSLYPQDLDYVQPDPPSPSVTGEKNRVYENRSVPRSNWT